MTGSPAIVTNDTVYRVDGSREGAGTSEIQGMRAALSLLEVQVHQLCWFAEAHTV